MGARSLARIHLDVSPSMLAEVESAANRVALSTKDFLREVIESDLAARRLKTIPPTKTGPGPAPSVELGRLGRSFAAARISFALAETVRSNCGEGF